MQLLVVRHGIAEDYSPSGSDDDRRLTEQGIFKTKLAARGLVRIADPVQMLLTSPKVRAMQTAEIFAAELGVKPTVLNELADVDPGPILQAIGHQQVQSLMIVGHEPTLGRIVSGLCMHGASRDFAPMKKSGCACLQVEMRPQGLAGQTRLLWLATPKMLRLLSGSSEE